MNTPYGWEWPDYIEADAHLDKYFKAQHDTVERRDLLHAKVDLAQHCAKSKQENTKKAAEHGNA